MAKRGVFQFDTLTPALKRLLPQVDAAVDLVFDHAEASAASRMRTGARWTDRTGNARNGLMALHQAEPMVRHTLVMYHSMPYGVWLEVRWSGRYAIIGPTMRDEAVEIAKNLVSAINRATRRV
jgi:hypothetical protein